MRNFLSPDTQNDMGPVSESRIRIKTGWEPTVNQFHCEYQLNPLTALMWVTVAGNHDVNFVKNPWLLDKMTRSCRLFGDVETAQV